MLRLLSFTLSAMLLISLGNQQEPPAGQPLSRDSVLLKTDLEFSDYSKQHGMKAAFLAYVAEEGVLLRPNSYPVVGKASIQTHQQSIADSTFTLTWEPTFADLAGSGEMGYTYGIYTLTVNGNVQEQGTYATVWKKDEKGDWKWVLDTGNPGLKKP